jgi:hypothetical protein
MRFEQLAAGDHDAFIRHMYQISNDDLVLEEIARRLGEDERDDFVDQLLDVLDAALERDALRAMGRGNGSGPHDPNAA